MNCPPSILYEGKGTFLVTQMITYIIRRLLLLIPTMLGIVVIVFGLLQIIPGDPATALLGLDATPEMIENMRRVLGTDQPWIVQLTKYLGRLLQGDLGESIFQKTPVIEVVFEHLPATIELALMSLLISALIGVPLGVLAAVKRGSPIDLFSMLFAQLGISIPVFWLGILLMLWFAVYLDWLPSIGRGEPLMDAFEALFSGHPEVLVDSLRHLMLPAITLGLNGAAIISRIQRSAMLEVLGEDFIRTARSKGLVSWKVVIYHAFRNSLLPVVSVMGLQFGVLLGGAVLTEFIFGWPGVGQLAITAIGQRDIPLVQGVVLIIAFLFSLINLVVDLLYVSIDPRIRLE